ncbi:Alpha-amylase precursor [Legionella beliardensis]|uniref:Alpha-amylase n=1 Tax=Legionella beliardensis TaxID=91822 RepID=A0A378I478_9GAMM|nr:alpha-amylase family protein [Legionella beliardensis]STX29496.1 Alpha-amylase precursor [Legionella beliardensis]
MVSLLKGFTVTHFKKIKTITGILFNSIFLTFCLNSLTLAATSNPKDVTVTLFQWKFDSIAKECTTTLGPLGYGYVEISPPQEHIQGHEWWTSYQPVSYRIAGRLGDEASFKAMINKCHAAGVKVIVDAVINHMSMTAGVGTGGSAFSKYDYPGLYQTQDFHNCRHGINDYANRYEVQHCELVGLADLDTASAYVQTKIADYFNKLISYGVDGFRIDAAKHISAYDLQGIKAKLSNPKVFWVQEVIYGEGEAVQPMEYIDLGSIDEFRYGRDLKRMFEQERLSYLSNFGEAWGYLPSNKARTFVDNWDTERNGSTLTYKNGPNYILANVFMLAHPYGAPNIYSGYEFSDFNTGPPNSGKVVSCFQDGWTCQHKRRQIANMVHFHNTVAGTPVTNWWSNDYQAIAFGRGNKGYVVINHENTELKRVFQTSLPAGVYCDILHAEVLNDSSCSGHRYTVDVKGQFTATIRPNDALALHVGAQNL